MYFNMRKLYGLLILIIVAFVPAFFVNAQTEAFDTRSVVKADIVKTDATSGKVIFTIQEGWHVNANPSSMDFLIPTKIEVADQTKSIDVTYPEGHKVETPLGTLLVYSNETTIPFKVNGEIPEAISLTAQACDGQICYPPSTWTIFFSTN